MRRKTPQTVNLFLWALILVLDLSSHLYAVTGRAKTQVS